jgi:hypothetical protein
LVEIFCTHRRRPHHSRGAVLDHHHQPFQGNGADRINFGSNAAGPMSGACTISKTNS